MQQVASPRSGKPFKLLKKCLQRADNIQLASNMINTILTWMPYVHTEHQPADHQYTAMPDGKLRSGATGLKMKAKLPAMSATSTLQ